MTETPPKASELLMRELEKIQKQLDEIRKSSTTSTPEHAGMPESAKGHKTTEEVADCPNCRPVLIEKLRPQILKEQREKIKSMNRPNRCDDCGEVYDKNTERECPSCHGTKG